MGENLFRFKQFSILQSDSVMKVGTDGVLLGAAVNCENALNILDIGTGTGLIALMMAQKCKANIYAIDLNPKAVEIASKNVSESPFHSRIVVENSSLQKYYPNLKFDLIVSNPPYFTTKVLAPDKNRAIARHDTELNISDFVKNAARLLSEDGAIWVIYPPEQTELFVNESTKNGFYVNSQINIFPRLDLNVVRIITEISKKETITQIKNICIEKSERHDYTDEYKLLTAPWYLKF